MGISAARHRRFIALLVAFAAAGVGLLMAAGWAGAFFSSQATAQTNTFTAGSLEAPANAAASQSAGTASTVDVSWNEVPDPGSGSFGYYVERLSGGTVSPACGTSPSSLITTTSCSDTDVPPGTYTYQVTAVYASWTAQGAATTSLKLTAQPGP